MLEVAWGFGGPPLGLGEKLENPVFAMNMEGGGVFGIKPVFRLEMKRRTAPKGKVKADVWVWKRLLKKIQGLHPLPFLTPQKNKDNNQNNHSRTCSLLTTRSPRSFPVFNSGFKKTKKKRNNQLEISKEILTVTTFHCYNVHIALRSRRTGAY